MTDEAIRQACLAFGYTALSRKQEMAVRGFLSGKDVFVMLPTGSGKSLCYSALPILFDKIKHRSGHIVLVVSPLVALMKDQVNKNYIFLDTFITSQRHKGCLCA